MNTLPIVRANDGAPCVLDSHLAEALGMESKYEARRIVQRHMPEMLTHGIVRQVDEKTGRRGRPSVAYQLNEQQAVLVCMFARTLRAADVRRAVIETFAAWRNGTLRPYRRPTIEPVRLVESFSLVQRDDRRFVIRLETMRMDVAKAVMEACLSPLLG